MGERGRWVLRTWAVTGCALTFTMPPAAIRRLLVPEVWDLVQPR